MIFSEPSPGFGGVGFRTAFLEGNPPEKLTWNLKKVQIRKRKKQFPSKVSIFWGFYVNLRGCDPPQKKSLKVLLPYHSPIKNSLEVLGMVWEAYGRGGPGRNR